MVAHASTSRSASPCEPVGGETKPKTQVAFSPAGDPGTGNPSSLTLPDSRICETTTFRETTSGRALPHAEGRIGISASRVPSLTNGGAEGSERVSSFTDENVSPLCPEVARHTSFRNRTLPLDSETLDLPRFDTNGCSSLFEEWRSRTRLAPNQRKSYTT